MPPESMQARLLLALLHPGDPVVAASLPANDHDWDSLGKLARIHHVRPLLGEALRRSAISDITPAGWRSAIQAECRAIAVQNLARQAETVRIIANLRDRAVQVMLLKGIHLATSVYGHAGLREMGDVDLLVREKDLAATAAALAAMGYRQERPLPVDVAIKGHHHLPPYRSQTGSTTEIHWTIASPDSRLTIDPDGLWRRAAPLRLGAHDAFGLCPEDLLLHLSLHATHDHGLEIGLRPYVDLVALTRRHRVDWEVVSERAREWKCTRGTYLALRVASELLGLAIPGQALERLRVAAGVTDAIVAAAIAQVFEPAGGPRQLSHHLSRLIADTPWRDRLRHLRERMAPPPEILAKQYGAAAVDGATPKAVWRLKRLGHLVRHQSGPAMRLFSGASRTLRNRAERQNLIGSWLAGSDRG